MSSERRRHWVDPVIDLRWKQVFPLLEAGGRLTWDGASFSVEGWGQFTAEEVESLAKQGAIAIATQSPLAYVLTEPTDAG